MRRNAMLSLVIATIWTGCVVGNQEPGLPDPEPGVGVGPDAGEDPGPGPDAAPDDCEPAAVTLPNGNHNPGQNCLTCHAGQAAGAPLWTVAGTLFDAANSTTPVAGATIILIDADQVEHKLITASNGNFYTGAAVALPVTVTASKCPDTRVMPGTAATGDCNSCHGPNSRIHLP